MMIDPVTERRQRAQALLEFLQRTPNEWRSVKSLSGFQEFGGKAVLSVINYLARREPVFTETVVEGTHKVKMVRYSPPPPGQCKFCRGRGCLVCGQPKMVDSE